MTLHLYMKSPVKFVNMPRREDHTKGRRILVDNYTIMLRSSFLHEDVLNKKLVSLLCLYNFPLSFNFIPLRTSPSKAFINSSRYNDPWYCIKILVALLLLSGSLKISSQHSTSVNALKLLCWKNLFKWWDKIKMTLEQPGQLVAFQHFMIHFSFFYGWVLWMTHLIQINEILDYLEDIFQKKT